MAIDLLHSNIRKRIEELLTEPYAGSKDCPPNHPQAKYLSNCHGTMAFVFGLENPIPLICKSHPDYLLYDKMGMLIADAFVDSPVSAPGSLLGFYQILSGGDALVHTALLIDNENHIFHQRGYGGIFEITSLDAAVNSYQHDNICVRAFKQLTTIDQLKPA